MNAFAGKWHYAPQNVTITVKETDDQVTEITMSDGRGPFTGFEVDLYAPVLSARFPDVPEKRSGVLSGDKIYWSNNTIWTRL
ncbi:MAG TPA: hypothetical protein VF824_06615 [Thermoanaerobaculia bacterium]|jgi:hypothetical protein